MQLNIEQRLNLLVLLGQLECRNVADTRNVWKLMEKIELTTEEKLAIDYVTQNMNGGGEAFNWNNIKAGEREPLSLDFSDGELSNLRRAIDACPRWLPSQARRWLEPLLSQMPEPPEPIAQGAARGA